MRQYEDPEDWPEVELLKASILFHKQEAERLQGEIPDNIVCSVFKISTVVIRDMLCAKHTKIAGEMIELIAKIAKATSDHILEDFEVSNLKVEAVPKNIVEMSAVKDYMDALPRELEKNQKVIKDCIDIYNTLDAF
jgi:dynein heavy chain